ncbi:MAG: hypothetical protein PHO13_07140 [Fermentimonas sp.]|jgi:hypothetical protein|nr:hypothetical protein [Fermentimonas sp.]MDD2931809.1 hypothetical protein [Fermentimonas sp.]MDD3189257.1 hypothetical protein [Fermentimonas sp.]MDD4285145.1 hypothetical protein [Fermentimonas sp.]MDD4724930.1 hypothetical protein [Fermentimonas sp.]
MNKKEIYSNSFTKSTQTFSFEIVLNTNNEYSLEITDYNNSSPDSEINKVIILEESIKDFVSALNQSVKNLKELISKCIYTMDDRR